MLRPATELRAGLLVVLAAVFAAGAAVSQQPQRPQPLGPAPPELGSVRRADEKPPQIEKVGFDQKLDALLPLDAVLRDESGATVTLGSFFKERPVVLVPVYYGCPMLCGVVLDNIVRSLSAVGLEPGKDMEIVIFSFNPDDDAEKARSRKDYTLARFPELAGASSSWHFLTADAETITRLTQTIGFRYERIPATGDFSHTSGIVIATPEGKISRYFFGIDYPGRDVRLALVEAAAMRIGTLTDHALLFCFRYDPNTGRYNALTLNIVRLAGAATVIALALALGLTLRRDRRRAMASRGPEKPSPEKLRTV